mmetsp:Transcript_21349/g.38634  ORF Transcript_21349/g.38634 Transcript_21349/m.38634 type:complete len:226 (+) Transcript_21349:821-1498(+)
MMLILLLLLLIHPLFCFAYRLLFRLVLCIPCLGRCNHSLFACKRICSDSAPRSRVCATGSTIAATQNGRFNPSHIESQRPAPRFCNGYELVIPDFFFAIRLGMTDNIPSFQPCLLSLAIWYDCRYDCCSLRGFSFFNLHPQRARLIQRHRKDSAWLSPPQALSTSSAICSLIWLIEKVVDPSTSIGKYVIVLGVPTTGDFIATASATTNTTYPRTGILLLDAIHA